MRLTLNRFTKILAAYGADPARWPDAEREAARQFAQDDAVAKQLLLEAQRLDAALDRMLAPAPALDPARLATAVMATPQAVPQTGSDPDWAVPWWRWFGWPKLAGLAVAGLLGILVGWAGIDAQLGVWMGADPMVAELPTPLPDPFLGDEWSW